MTTIAERVRTAEQILNKEEWAIGDGCAWHLGAGKIVAINDGWAWIRTRAGGFATQPLELLVRRWFRD